MSEYPELNLKSTCRHLRHKMMYCDERQMERGMVDVSSDTAVCFCIKTQEVLGPDTALVDPATCQPERSCYCAR